MLLQLLHGGERPQLRTPFMREALERLGREGILERQEAEGLQQAYQFLRALINGLRMLRGNAEDLFLPPQAAEEGLGRSDEYVHLARRMGYAEAAEGELSPARRLRLDFETHTAFVRAFVERRLGRDAWSHPGGEGRVQAGSVADLVLSERLSEEHGEQILSRAGFREPARALRNLRGIAAAAGEAGRLDFARLAVLAADLLGSQSDPDMALNNWERFARGLPRPAEHLRLLAAQPRRLEILLAVFAGSQYLSDALIRSPEVFEWATGPAHLLRMRSTEEMRRELDFTVSDEDWRRELRRTKNRELVRLGIRDICLGVSIEEIMAELSSLAEAVIQVELARCLRRLEGPAFPGEFCLVAFGKLGGRELNYSSDIDLLALVDQPLGAEEQRAVRSLMGELREDLSGHTEEGYVYRVDLRLRPFGRSGELVSSLEGLSRYYRSQAALWEIQALLRARPVAGSATLGERFARMRQRLVPEYMARQQADVGAAIEELRVKARRRSGLPEGPNIKLDSGGIRDVEFLVQGLQLMHLGEGDGMPASGNTLEGIGLLEEAGLLPPAEAAQLRRDYLFLRRIEHYLQVFEDRQTHTLPSAPEELQALARRMLGAGAGAEQLERELEAAMTGVRRAYERFLLRRADPSSTPPRG
jgi:glutamate-ammonia-ligase adenylyltransferase